MTPQFFNKKSNKLSGDGDANGFSQIGIKIKTRGLGLEIKKKCGFYMIYKKDIEDIDQTMAQYSNKSITPYEGFDVPHHI